MYNLIFCANNRAGEILGLLGLTTDTVPRFRDVDILEQDGQKVIAIYARMGDGNREHDDWSPPGQIDTHPGPDCLCNACVMEFKLAAHANYLSDADDDFDKTYATYYFSFPEGADQEAFPVTSAQTGEEKWGEFFKRLEQS